MFIDFMSPLLLCILGQSLPLPFNGFSVSHHSNMPQPEAWTEVPFTGS